MRKLPYLLPVFGLAFACGGGGAPAKCDEAACKAVCAQAGSGSSAAKPATPAPSGGLTAFESKLVDPMLADIRAGVRPFADETTGICQGQGKECEAFVGTSGKDLAEGEYMLRAELRVPKAGEKGTWKVRLETSCETTTKTKSGESKNTRTSSKEYDVRYVGEERGYRLSPLYKITSPRKGGAQACTYKLVMPHPDGDKSIEGEWSVPAEEEEG